MARKKRIFLAGKTIARDQSDVVVKYDSAERLLSKYYSVFNPIKSVPPGASWALATRHCIKELMDCDAIFMLKDWKDSPHATLMNHIATICELEISYESE